MARTNLSACDAVAGLLIEIARRNWMFFSTATIIFNKWLLDNAGFRMLFLCIAIE